VDSRAGLDAVAKRKIPCPCRKSILGRPARRLVSIHRKEFQGRNAHLIEQIVLNAWPLESCKVTVAIQSTVCVSLLIS